MVASEDIRWAIDRLIEREGGFVNDPADRGGATKYGVTQATLTHYLGRKATIQEVRNLTPDTARQIISSIYVQTPKIYLLEDRFLFEMVLDWLYHSTLPTPGKALLPIKILQQCLNTLGGKLVADGKMGVNTAAAANGTSLVFSKWALYNDYLDERIEFLLGITVDRPANLKFIKGWHRRVRKFRRNP